jgi:hypothetical protein
MYQNQLIMTQKTFIRLIFLVSALAISAVLFSTSRPAATPTGEDGIQCREKNDDCRAQSDNTQVWESLSRHLLGANQ